MARSEITVEDVDAFSLPTGGSGTEINNSGDGLKWLEKPGHPATVGIFNNSGSSRTITISAAPNAPGGAADLSLTIGTTRVGIILPGMLPSIFFRRDDDQETDPGYIYIDADSSSVFCHVVRGPTDYSLTRGPAGSPSLASSRELVDTQIATPGGALPVDNETADGTNGNGCLLTGGEAIGVGDVAAANSWTTVFTVNPFNRFGRTSNITWTSPNSGANEFVVFPPGCPHPELLRRNDSTDGGAVYFTAKNNTRICVAKLARRMFAQ